MQRLGALPQSWPLATVVRPLRERQRTENPKPQRRCTENVRNLAPQCELHSLASKALRLNSAAAGRERLDGPSSRPAVRWNELLGAAATLASPVDSADQINHLGPVTASAHILKRPFGICLADDPLA
ncbi:hypothetical protein C7S18_06195 [Ahniella affigens]|uniref:Uncharacterized protein n=1 Tax=Ahniella affigens TaxID=2021234 RepID=A0A2P1PPQ2_9GAMM|nr:hypothetical protein C7S18_06195 [Ahniella affigens]